jgi:hypothetical protein
MIHMNAQFAKLLWMYVSRSWAKENPSVCSMAIWLMSAVATVG